jgi:hypothetical protein
MKLSTATDFSWRIWYPQSAASFITCIEHRYAVVLFGFSGHDATFSLMWYETRWDEIYISAHDCSRSVALN